MPDTTGHATEDDIESVKAATANYNDERKREKLRRQIQRAHEWRVQVWAQSEVKIRAAQTNLAILGDDPIELFRPDFENEESLHRYSTMTLSK